MPRKKIVMTAEAADAARILGQQIRLARHANRMTAARLAELADVTPRAITLIERGDPAVSFGNVLNAAVYAGVPLFDITDPKTLSRMRQQGEQALTLIPSNVRNRREREIDAEF
ncbi:transcriptional regulator with XRE-family HTH domain [Microbacterium sp. AK009]|uniref:helix-turn-helix transcriptional regulator n=1 Tax=Microbacterium sp. AK009 TaxID=2723068 RepID=UPI0015CB4E39|nr:helix-turn-helix transcriptional regulator [Microbacterium sp. AK009]NYF16150.1 transcriptional regulator with XRE-family HTH domain [Microbacterium sp. AK009]